MSDKIAFKLKLCTILILLVSFQPTTFAWTNTLKDKVSANNTSMNANEMSITHNSKGNTYLKEGYPLHAINEYKLGILMNPNSTMSATIYNNLGRAYEVIKSYNHAISCYEHAIRINPNFSVYHKNLVQAYINKKALNKAEINYYNIIKENPKDAQAHYILALIYLKEGNNNKAKEMFKEFLELQPGVDLADSARKYLNQLEVQDH